MTLRSGIGVLLCMVGLAACVPVTVPEQLAYTPGPGVTIAGRTYDSGTFQVDYPAGWRLITSGAGDPISVIFAAPEGDALIMLGEAITDAPNPPGDAATIRNERREIVVGEPPDAVTVTAILNAGPDNWPAYVAAFERVVGSVRPA